MIDDIFGEWLMAPGGDVCHMHLGPVKSLCGVCRFTKKLVPATDVAQKRFAATGSGFNRNEPDPYYVNYCPECVAAYEQHWLEMYPPARPLAPKDGRIVSRSENNSGSRFAPTPRT